MVIDRSGNAINRPIITNKPNAAGGSSVNNTMRRNTATTAGFDSIFQQKLTENGDIKFSKHAELRLQSRNISLTQAQMNKMKEAVAKAEAKGVKDSLVLMDSLAFVVNVRNRTVITAANSNELSENVFTNIDGAVIL